MHSFSRFTAELFCRVVRSATKTNQALSGLFLTVCYRQDNDRRGVRSNLYCDLDWLFYFLRLPIKTAVAVAAAFLQNLIPPKPRKFQSLDLDRVRKIRQIKVATFPVIPIFVSIRSHQKTPITLLLVPIVFGNLALKFSPLGSAGFTAVVRDKHSPLRSQLIESFFRQKILFIPHFFCTNELGW